MVYYDMTWAMCMLDSSRSVNEHFAHGPIEQV
jgi:hypothetical protein